MPTDPADGLLIAFLFILGVLAMLMFLAWLEAPSDRRQQASTWLKSRFVDDRAPAVNGRHRGTVQPLPLRHSAATSAGMAARRGPARRDRT